MTGLKVALVHDDLIQWGGAERMLLALTEVFPSAPVYTSVFDDQNPLLRQKFMDKHIITTFLQNFPGKVTLYRGLLPFYSLAFEQFDFSDFDVVISQTTRFAKSVITKPHTLHISYVHTPPRFLWNFSGESQPAAFRGGLSYLRLEDFFLSRRPDIFWAGSENAKQRIRRVYRQEAKVLYPFVDVYKTADIEGFDGGYYLVISRLVRYKRVDLVIEAFNKNGRRLKVIGGGPELGHLSPLAGPNIEFLGLLPDALVVNLLSGAKGVIVAGEEDFGLMPLEAQALGKGVIAYGKGGALETVIDGKTGVLFKNQTADSLLQALERFEKLGIKPATCRQNAARFSRESFERQLMKLIRQATRRPFSLSRLVDII